MAVDRRTPACLFPGTPVVPIGSVYSSALYGTTTRCELCRDSCDIDLGCEGRRPESRRERIHHKLDSPDFAGEYPAFRPSLFRSHSKLIAFRPTMPNDRDDQPSQKLTAPPDFDGPTQNRHCTDVLCMLMLIATWVVMTGIGLYAVSNGDYRLVLYPLDYDGNICGTDFQEDMTDYPYLLYVSNVAGVCANKCPRLTNETSDGLTDIHTLVTYSGVWQTSHAELPIDFIQVANYSESENARACTQDTTGSTCFPNLDDPVSSWNSRGVRQGSGYAFYAASTYMSMWRCFVTSSAHAELEKILNTPTDGVNLPGLSVLNDVYAFWNRLYADLWSARAYVLGFGFGVSFVLSLIYIFLLRIPMILTVLIWSSILISIAMFFAGGWYAWVQADDWDNEDPQTVDNMTIKATKGAAVFLWVVGVLLAMLACCLRRQIQLAILCVKEAGRAVNSMIAILLVPFLEAAGFIVFLVIFAVYGVYLASLGEITINNPSSESPIDMPDIPYRTYEFDTFVIRCGWFMLFCLFWTANFIVAVGDLIVAVAVAKWYFTRNKLLIGSWTVFFSIKDVLIYHLGTCAFGSLLIAIVQLIRAAIAKAQKTAKKTENKALQWILCCCQCCFWCLEKFIKFINKNAYIQTAIFSTSFCKSCQESFALIFRNAARVGAVTYVSAAVLVVGKLFISAITTGLGYMLIVENMKDELFSVGGPVTIIFLISYWVSDFFMNVFDMGISTVLHCFIADEEMFSGSTCYAEAGLKRYIDQHGGKRNSSS